MTIQTIPIGGVNSQIASAHTAVIAIGIGPNGGVITNPLLAADQGISVAEVLYVDPVGNCGGGSLPAANHTVFALQPGQSWTVIPGQVTATYVNAATASHSFSVVSW
jgi:hypothetical protein